MLDDLTVLSRDYVNENRSAVREAYPGDLTSRILSMGVINRELDVPNENSQTDLQREFPSFDTSGPAPSFQD